MGNKLEWEMNMVKLYTEFWKSGAKGIKDAKTPLYKYETSINQSF